MKNRKINNKKMKNRKINNKNIKKIKKRI
jgi:hypothetical protein